MWSSSFGGFLFEFDTAVTPGAREAIQIIWNLSALEYGFTVSVALIGTVLGAFFVEFLVTNMGERRLKSV